MLNWLRSIVFIVWLYGWIVILGFACLPTLFLPRKACLIAIRSWAAIARFGLRWICGIKTVIRGQENMPEGACLVASKHQSMYDVLMPFLYAKDPAFVLKKELFFYPIFGWYGWKAEMIPIDRGGYVKTLKKMLARAKKVSDAGRQIFIFPEGTRTMPGAKADYKTGVFAMYNELQTPCAPVALITGHVWPRKGILRKPGTIIFEIQPSIEAGLQRKEFMSRLEHAIEPAVNRLMAEVGLEISTQDEQEESLST